MERREIILATIYFLSQHIGEKQVSYSALVDCILEIQKESNLGYEFSKKLPYYSYELSEDLRDLKLSGYIKRYKYRSAPLSKNFIALRPLGKGHAKKVVKILDPKVLETLRKAVKRGGK